MDETDSGTDHLSNLLIFFDNLANAPVGAGAVTRDTRLLADGVLDSLNLFMLISHIEESTGIMIEPDDVTPENFATLGTVCALLERTSGST